MPARKIVVRFYDPDEVGEILAVAREQGGRAPSIRTSKMELDLVLAHAMATLEDMPARERLIAEWVGGTRVRVFFFPAPVPPPPTAHPHL